MPFIPVIEFLELCKYLGEHPVVQAEMVAVKRTPKMPPPTKQPATGVEIEHETSSPRNVAELVALLAGQ